MKILLIFLFVGLTSCNNAKKADSFKQEKLLNLKNATSSDIKMLMINSNDTLSILLSSNSIFEVIGLRDHCESFEHTLKNKIDYLSYQRGDNQPTVLIDKNSHLSLTDFDILAKAKPNFTYVNGGFERVVVNYPLD